MKKVMLFLFSLLSLINLSAQDEFIFVGHRGASHLAPENTLASYELAWELGVKAAECDIMLTKDEKVIVFHDKTGKRLTGQNFTVKDANYDDIKEYPIKLKETNLPKYADQTIPLLSDLLEIIPEGGTLVIEIKTGVEILPYMQKVISEYWKSGNIAFIAFDFKTILKTKMLYPEIPCYYLSAFNHDINSKFDEIVESDLDGVNLRHAIISKKLVKKFNSVDKGVWCWTVNDPKDALRMIEYGVSAITTDRPKWLYEAVFQ
jgi:glycerophosphoryl diester phosphodiesterase